MTCSVRPPPSQQQLTPEEIEKIPPKEDNKNGNDDIKSLKNNEKYSFFNLNNLAMFIVLLATIFYTLFQYSTVNNVVRLIDLLPGSYQIPDTNRSIFEIIESRGFQYEQHFVTTEDGYILQLVRLINPFIPEGYHRKSLKPVLLHHGFQLSGSAWLVATNGKLDDQGIYYEFDEQHNIITNGSQVGNTLGFVLASSRDYDVWLANYRGTVYSTNHTTLDAKSAEYWKFSIDEMIRYDLPAEIDYILAKTGYPTLGYIGYSQGNLMMLSLLSTNEEYSKRIKPYIAISPVWDLYDSSLTKMSEVAVNILQPILNAYPRKIAVDLSILKNFCSNQYTRELCYNLYFKQFVGQLNNVMIDRLPVYMGNLGLGSSTWNLDHIIQNIKNNGQFKRYDYGSEEINKKIYGQPKAPEYNLSNINNTNIAFIYGESDSLCPTNNIKQIIETLNVNLLDVYQVPDYTYDHVDLIWGKDVGRMVNKRVLDILSSIYD